MKLKRLPYCEGLGLSADIELLKYDLSQLINRSATSANIQFSRKALEVFT